MVRVRARVCVLEQCKRMCVRVGQVFLPYKCPVRAGARPCPFFVRVVNRPLKALRMRQTVGGAPQ